METERWNEETESCNLFVFIEKRLAELLVDRSATESLDSFSVQKEKCWMMDERTALFEKQNKLSHLFFCFSAAHEPIIYMH